jgi:hypothetical protein
MTCEPRDRSLVSKVAKSYSDGLRRAGAQNFKRVVYLGLIALGLGAPMAVVGASWLERPIVTLHINPLTITPNAGRAYSAPIAWRRFPYTIESDDMVAKRSTLRLFENETRLGPSHSYHDAIQATGRGEYSHWQGYLVFSSTDGTDPRTNGRQYVAKIRASLDLSFLIASATVFVGSLVFCGWCASRAKFPRNDFRNLSLGLLTIASIVVVNIDFFETTQFYPLLTSDSASYVTLEWMQVRGFLQPAIFDSLLWLNDTGRLIVPIQLNVMIGSFLLFGWSIARISDRPLAGWATVLILIWNLDVTSHALFLMSESLFVAFTTLYSTFALRLLHRPTSASAILTGATAALAILIRPVGLALISGFAIIFSSTREIRFKTTAYVLGSCAMLLLAFGAVPYQLSYGQMPKDGYGGVALLGHVATLATPGANSKYPELYNALVAKLEPEIAAADINYPDKYWEVTSDKYNPLLYQIILPEIVSYMSNHPNNFPGVDMKSTFQLVAANPVAWSLAESIIEQHPLRYGRHVAAHVYGMWRGFFGSASFLSTVPDVWIPIAIDEFNVCCVLSQYFGGRYAIASDLDPGPPRNLWSDQMWSFLLTVFPSLHLILPPILIGSALIAVMIIGLKYRPSPVWRGFAFLGVGVWSYTILVAAFQPTISRYATICEPLLVGQLVLCASGLVDLLQNLGVPQKILRVARSRFYEATLNTLQL